MTVVRILTILTYLVAVSVEVPYPLKMVDFSSPPRYPMETSWKTLSANGKQTWTSNGLQKDRARFLHLVSVEASIRQEPIRSLRSWMTTP